MRWDSISILGLAVVVKTFDMHIWMLLFAWIELA